MTGVVFFHRRRPWTSHPPSFLKWASYPPLEVLKPFSGIEPLTVIANGKVKCKNCWSLQSMVQCTMVQVEYNGTSSFQHNHGGEEVLGKGSDIGHVLQVNELLPKVIVRKKIFLNIKLSGMAFCKTFYSACVAAMEKYALPWWGQRQWGNGAMLPQWVAMMGSARSLVGGWSRVCSAGHLFVISLSEPKGAQLKTSWLHIFLLIAHCSVLISFDGYSLLYFLKLHKSV